MKQAARIREIVAILSASRHPVHRDVFLEALEVSLATFKRDIETLRDQMQAPIEYVAAEGESRGGYILEKKDWVSGKHGLPNVWFSASELYAILMIDELAKHIGPGLLSEHLRDLIPRITMALSSGGDSADRIRSKIKIMTSASRRNGSPFFDTVTQATVNSERLEILYYTRTRNERSTREVSPLRIIHYKENWYLFAWCHKSDGIRMFAMDAIEDAKNLKKPAKTVANKQVDEVIGKGFGIYLGGNISWATLRFNAKQAPWISSEVWHPEQHGQYLNDGRYELKVPYSNPNELILEILKYGENVEVIEPASLRQEIATRLSKAAKIYSSNERQK